MILCIETATSVCSVALCSDEKVISVRESKDGKSHSALLTVLINDLLSEQKIKVENLDAVSVSKGPGSFTGLRIGVSVAKGIAYGAGIPLIGIDTLTSMYYGFISLPTGKIELNENTLFCPMIDAKRMEVYYCLFDYSGRRIKEITAEEITADTFSDITAEITIVFFGDGAGKCSKVIKRNKQIFLNEFQMSAAYMHIPSINALKEKKFENTAYFEPFYLKDFMVTKPRKKLF